MNAQIKGGVINIYPLQIIDQLKSDKQRTYPNLQEVRPLTKFVTLKPNSDPRLAKLVQNTFSKVVMVTNYPLAMQVAKEHNLTCITPDHQIVYAGAFITQVGQFNRMTMDRPTLYRRISGIEGQIEEKVVQAFGFEKHRDQLADRDLEAMRKLQRAEVNIASLKSGYQQMKSMLFEYRSQVEYKQQHTAEVERHIEEYKAQEAEIEVKIRALEGQAKQSGEVFSQADSMKLVEVNKMIDELGRKLAAQESERMQTLGKIKSKKSLLNEKYLKKQNDIQLNMLEQEMNGKEGAMQGSQSQLTMSDIDKERGEVEGQIQRYMADLESKNKELKALYQLIEESDQNSGADILPIGGASNGNEEVIAKLRGKILEIQDLSYKMDELQSKNDELDLQARKIESYDKQVYEESRKNKTVQQLTREIQEKAMELDKMPRKNRHCVEWYDKYSAKNKELMKKFAEQIATEEGIMKLLIDMDQQKQ